MKRYALFSLNETKKIDDFARALISLGWSIVATAKPYEALRKVGIDAITVNEFVNVSNNYNFPPTLHPEIENALTNDSAEKRIELVYDITYSPEVGNDVGGHTLLALAAKGDRLPVSSYDDMCEVVSLIEKEGRVPDPKRMEFIAKAYFKVAKHYGSVLTVSGQQQYDVIAMRKELTLINGENPYQVPSDLMSIKSEDPLALQHFNLKTNNVPCFTNMADIDCIVDTLSKLAVAFNTNCGKIPFVTVAAKHGNACGIGADWNSPSESICKALWGNPLAIWGGEVVLNFPLTRDLSSLLYASDKRKQLFGNDKWMLDVILTPGIDEEAKRLLGQRADTKILVNPSLERPSLTREKWSYRFVRGGVLRQPPASYILDLKDVKWVGQPLKDSDVDSLIVAWGCSFTSHHGGNEVAIAKDGYLLGAGGGPSTVEAAEIAVNRGSRYNGCTKGAVFAADAFFPFTDAPKILVNAGCKGGVAPSGGIRETEIIEFFNNKGLSVAFLKRDCRGFCRH